MTYGGEENANDGGGWGPRSHSATMCMINGIFTTVQQCDYPNVTKVNVSITIAAAAMQ